jgi:curved DNA-binding protein CbpA
LLKKITIMPTHYETLGIEKDASEKEIKQAYRALSM